jgi:periplasmic protein TonB
MSVALSQEEKKNERIAAGISVAVHIILLLLLIYIMAWRAPDPPAAELGIELNFGMDQVGSGDVQTMATPNESKNVEDSKPAPTQPDARPEPKPTVQPTPPTPVETPKVQTTTADAPVSVKEDVKPQPKPQPKEEVVKKEPEKPKALYPGKPTTSTGTGKSGTSDEATGNNNGDNPGTVGDKGSPDGKLDAKALYGKSGGGAGGSLNMAGWAYDVNPKQDPYTNETGTITFRIKIDADGNLISVTRVSGTVSPQVERWYKEQLQKTTFSRTGSNSDKSTGATGTVTFIIKSK